MNRSTNKKQVNACFVQCLLWVFGLTLFASPVSAQVFDLGPSDSALFSNVISLPPDPNIGAFQSVGTDTNAIFVPTTQLNVFDGGSVGWLFSAFKGSEININGGTVGINFKAFNGSEVNISGGSVGDEFEARGFSEVNVSGGSIGDEFLAAINSEVNISGGSIGEEFDAESGSEVNISGGTVGQRFEALPGSDVELIGGEFRLNGTAFSEPTISLASGDVFTGTLADGSTFIFADVDSFLRDSLSNVTLTQTALPAPNFASVVVSTAYPNFPSGVRAGQTLTLLNGGELGSNFEVVDATLNVEGGSLGEYAGAARSIVNISGGTVGNRFYAQSGSEVNISGGSVGYTFSAYSEVNISGGSVGDNFSAYAGSKVNISGGSLDFRVWARSGSEFNISGGSVDNRFKAVDGSEVNLFGSDFVLDGVPLDESLSNGQAFTIVDRDVTLTGTFADGTTFSFDLNSNDVSFGNFFDPDAKLTVTLGSPLPTNPLGDCNFDGDVDFLDISPFISTLTAGSFLEEADCNQDGVVSFLDISPFIGILTNQ